MLVMVCDVSIIVCVRYLQKTVIFKIHQCLPVDQWDVSNLKPCKALASASLGSQYGRLRDLLPALRGDFRKFGTTKLKNWERVLGKDLGQAKVGDDQSRGIRRNSLLQFSVVFTFFVPKFFNINQRELGLMTRSTFGTWAELELLKYFSLCGSFSTFVYRFSMPGSGGYFYWRWWSRWCAGSHEHGHLRTAICCCLHPPGGRKGWEIENHFVPTKDEPTWPGNENPQNSFKFLQKAYRRCAPGPRSGERGWFLPALPLDWQVKIGTVPSHPRVFYFQSYLEASRLALQQRLISIDGLQRVRAAVESCNLVRLCRLHQKVGLLVKPIEVATVSVRLVDFLCGFWAMIGWLYIHSYVLCLMIFIYFLII